MATFFQMWMGKPGGLLDFPYGLFDLVLSPDIAALRPIGWFNLADIEIHVPNENSDVHTLITDQITTQKG